MTVVGSNPAYNCLEVSASGVYQALIRGALETRKMLYLVGEVPLKQLGEVAGPLVYNRLGTQLLG